MVSGSSVNERRTPVIVARSLALAWILLSLLDAVLTYVCLQNEANVEGNPFARGLLDFNEALFYGAKVLVTGGIGLGFWWLAGRTTHHKPMIGCQVFLILLFTAVLVNNLLHL
ncbi:MAG: hypothetical protein IBX68_07975 [Dehalococcoidia bacterium]|nr:hypothetical protein [Dehalococcoidia bacterium]